MRLIPGKLYKQKRPARYLMPRKTGWNIVDRNTVLMFLKKEEIIDYGGAKEMYWFLTLDGKTIKGDFISADIDYFFMEMDTPQ